MLGRKCELRPAPPRHPRPLFQTSGILPPRALGTGARALFLELHRRPGRRSRDRRSRRGSVPGLAAVEGGLMEGGITARPQDCFALLVGASIVALFSALVATLCIK